MARRLTDKDPRKEQRRQERILALLERKHRRKFAAEIRRASSVMLSGYRERGSVPGLDDEHAMRLRVLYENMAADAIEAFGGRIVGQGKNIGLVPERRDFAHFFTRIATEYVADEMVRQRIVAVSLTTRQGIVDQVARGQAGGLGAEAIARSIAKAVPSIAITRGAVIARTETHGAANAGADAAARATGLKLRKEWVATSGGRTRDAHRDANGSIVDMDEPFIVGGERLRYPGDPAGSAANTINCRCAVSHIVDDGIE